ncbi:MAG: rod shape-determining protein RodA [Fimbriimonadaceae bacterium]|nr:rod shape-determining protein RodA [Fimbriimonadaceae bacterium]
MISAHDLRGSVAGRSDPTHPRFDFWLLLSAVVLVIVGMMALYSVGSADKDFSLFRKQGLLLLVGLVPFFIFLFVDPAFWRKISGWLYAANVAFLGLVLFKGANIKGATRWIEVGGFQFQPSEIAKLLVILTLAAFYANRMDEIKRFSTFVLSLIYIAPPLFLIYEQPHLGSTIVILVAWAGISICAGVPWRFLVTFAALAVALFVGAYSTGKLRSYQVPRIAALFGADEKKEGYQQLRATVAIGVGGVGGTGYLKGEQKSQVPEHHNDFIFSVIGEEGGLVGCTMVLAAFSFFFYRAWLVLYHGEDPYTRMIAAGILSVLAFHTVLNLGMNLNLMPVVGLWLPFLSYGGTAMWLCLSCVALLLNLARRERVMKF